jgi:hypothetical protein
MAVKRIVANIATDHVEDAKAFYTDILGLMRPWPWTACLHRECWTGARPITAAPPLARTLRRRKSRDPCPFRNASPGLVVASFCRICAKAWLDARMTIVIS